MLTIEMRYNGQLIYAVDALADKPEDVVNAVPLAVNHFYTMIIQKTKDWLDKDK